MKERKKSDKLPRIKQDEQVIEQVRTWNKGPFHTSFLLQKDASTLFLPKDPKRVKSPVDPKLILDAVESTNLATASVKEKKN